MRSERKSRITIEIAWWFHPKGKTPEYSSEWVPIGSSGGESLQIPPNTVTEHQGYTVLKSPAMLHNFQPHMHYRGKAQTLEAIYPDGRREVINQCDEVQQYLAHQLHLRPGLRPCLPKGDGPDRSRPSTTIRPPTRTTLTRVSG